jgi:hypothetical protein
VIFIIRTRHGEPALNDPRLRIVHRRATPRQAATARGQVDLFCTGDDDAPQHAAATGGEVVRLHDGWYADDDAVNASGGVAVWGGGRFWEVRATPFDVIAHD